MIYIVTSGDYSAYMIEAVFQRQDKAEAYCKCHPDSRIEEYELSDDNLYTSYDVVYISMKIRLNANSSIHFTFNSYAKEDSCISNNNTVFVYSSDYIDIDLCRLLPDKYDVETIINKYKKVFYDLIPEIKYILSDVDSNSYDHKVREYLSRLIEEYIANKFGIEVENI